MNFIILGIAIVLAGLGGITARFIFKKTDNVVEEMAEKFIERKIGIDIDLSPDTPDPDKKGKL